MYAPQAAAAPPKISAAQMPNVVAVQEADEARYSSGEGLFRSSVVYDILPPMPTTDVTILDDGNCSSHFMRSTMYHVPNSEDLASSSKLPLSLIVQPFAKLTPRQAPVPVVDFGEKGPLRCTRCRAYINVFVTFLRGGRTFECNICSMNNDVPDEYFCNLDASGRRSDIGQRPELLYGTVDFLASKEYIMRKPKPPYLLFVIDTSRSSIQNGAFASALIAIREHIEAHLNDGNARVYQKMGIVTFDKNISIYDLRASEPQILVMSDVHEPFVPLSDGLFFDPLVACEQAFALLDRLPSLFTETRIVDSCLGAAAAFALEAMKSHGGRVVLFNTTLPNVGIGLLRNRDSAAPSGTDKVNPLVLSQGDFYSKIGSQAAALGVSYVLVSTPSGFMDIATIGILVLYFTKDFRTPIQRN
jgi:protein transport protein SEC24